MRYITHRSGAKLNGRSVGLRLLQHGRLESLDIGGRQLRTVDLDRQFIELRSQGEWRLVVGVVHAGKGVGPDIEALVPLQNHWQRLWHCLGIDDPAVHFEGPRAGPADAAEVVEREGASAYPVVFKVELDRMPS